MPRLTVAVRLTDGPHAGKVRFAAWIGPSFERHARPDVRLFDADTNKVAVYTRQPTSASPVQLARRIAGQDNVFSWVPTFKFVGYAGDDVPNREINGTPAETWIADHLGDPGELVLAAARLSDDLHLWRDTAGFSELAGLMADQMVPA